MKKTFLLCCFSLIVSFIDAQNNTSSYFVSVTGLPIIYPNSNSGIRDAGIQGYAIYGSFGRYFSSRFSIGIRPFYGKVQAGFERNEEIINAFGLNTFGRFNLLNEPGKIQVFMDASVGFGRLWYQSDDFAREARLSRFNGPMFNFAFGPGMNLSIGGGFELELYIQYLHMKNLKEPEATTTGQTVIPSLGFKKNF